MHIVLVTQYKKKLSLLGMALLLWTAVLIPANTIIRSNLLFNITINDQLVFSYPFTFIVENVYINERLSEGSIQTNSNFFRPRQLKFSTYNSIQGKFSFEYPSMYTLSLKDFAGSEILYHIDFQEKSHAAHGFVQVWNLPYSLEEFLNSSKSTSLQNYTHFEERPITVNGLPGYLWDYSFSDSSNNSYKGTEVFLKKDGRMYRISYFVPEKEWNESHHKIFLRIVNSFKVE
jgi:hypothetical protein